MEAKGAKSTCIHRYEALPSLKSFIAFPSIVKKSLIVLSRQVYMGVSFDLPWLSFSFFLISFFHKIVLGSVLWSRRLEDGKKANRTRVRRSLSLFFPLLDAKNDKMR